MAAKVELFVRFHRLVLIESGGATDLLGFSRKEWRGTSDLEKKSVGLKQSKVSCKLHA